jgi:PRTRC genetic system protein F
MLPRIGDDIPHAIMPRELAHANAGIARFLLEAKSIRQADVPAQWRDVIEVCATALNAWLQRELGALHCIAPQFVMRPLISSHASRSPPSHAAPSEYEQIDLVWFQQHEQQWVIGNGVERLEQQVPRLGATVLDILDRQSRFAYPVFVPRIAQEMASMMYWYGEADETMAVEECCGDDRAAQQEMLQGMVTKSDIDAAYPDWALSWKPPTLNKTELMQVIQHCNDRYAAEVASQALQLSRMRIKDTFRPDIEGEFIGFGAVLSWREDDVTIRIYDDLLNMAHESEFCDLIGEVSFELHDPQAMQRWQRSMRQRFKAMRLIDRLIWRLAEAN